MIVCLHLNYVLGHSTYIDVYNCVYLCLCINIFLDMYRCVLRSVFSYCVLYFVAFPFSFFVRTP